MTQETWLAILVPLAQGLGTVLTAVALYVLRRLYHTMNSKMDRLLDITAKAAKAEGVLEGRRAEREEAGRG